MISQQYYSIIIDILFCFFPYTVESWACASNIKIDGQIATIISSTGNTCESAYLTRPPLDLNGCYSISVKRISESGGRVGFGLNDAVSRDMADVNAWKLGAYVALNGATSGFGLGTIVTGMGRGIGTDTLTIMYNPSAGTLHGAYNLEPAILLRKDIPAGQNAPLQPYFAASTVGTSIMVVNNPRQN